MKAPDLGAPWVSTLTDTTHRKRESPGFGSHGCRWVCTSSATATKENVHPRPLPADRWAPGSARWRQLGASAEAADTRRGPALQLRDKSRNSLPLGHGRTTGALGVAVTMAPENPNHSRPNSLQEREAQPFDWRPEKSNDWPTHGEGSRLGAQTRESRNTTGGSLTHCRRGSVPWFLGKAGEQAGLGALGAAAAAGAHASDVSFWRARAGAVPTGTRCSADLFISSLLYRRPFPARSTVQRAAVTYTHLPHALQQSPLFSMDCSSARNKPMGKPNVR